MKIDYKVKQGAPKKRKTDQSEEKKFTDFFWSVIGAVRGGQYKVDNFDSVAEQIEEERKLKNI